MSSSTFVFDPVAKVRSPALELFWSAVIFIAIAAAIMLPVALVDPFDSQLSPVRLNVDRLTNFRPLNVALWAAFDIQRDAAESKQAAQIVAIGDSRGEQMRGGFQSARSLAVVGKHLYDLSFGGATLYKMLAFFRHYRSQFAKPQTLIITLPISKLVPLAWTIDRSEQSFQTAENPLLYFAGLKNIELSFGWLFSHPKLTPTYVPPWRQSYSLDNVSPNPACTTSADTSVGTPGELVQLKAALRFGIQIVRQQIAPFISEVKAQGIHVVIYIPPTSPPITSYIQTQMPTVAASIVKALGELAPVYQMSPSFSAKVGFADGVHLCAAAAMQELPLLAQEAKL